MSLYHERDARQVFARPRLICLVFKMMLVVTTNLIHLALWNHCLMWSFTCRVKLQLQKEYLKINTTKEKKWLQLELLKAEQAEFVENDYCRLFYVIFVNTMLKITFIFKKVMTPDS